jgi:hypothetical protein
MSTCVRCKLDIHQKGPWGHWVNWEDNELCWDDGVYNFHQPVPSPLTPRQQFAKWLSQRLTDASIRVAVWGGASVHVHRKE